MTDHSGKEANGFGAAEDRGTAGSGGLPSSASAPAEGPAPIRLPLRHRITPENLLQHIDWTSLARGVVRRVWLIALIAAVSLALGILGALRTGRVRYETRASLLYRSERQKQALAAVSDSPFTIKGLARSTALSLLRRTSNMETVRTRLQLGMEVEELRWRIQTYSEKNSEIILLTVGSMPTAESAVTVANEMVRVALADNLEFYRSQALQAAAQFERQALQARSELEELSQQLTTFQATHRLLEAAADTTSFLDHVAVVTRRLSEARLACDSQQIRIENYRKIIAGLPDEVMRESFEDNPLKRRISNTEVALMEARTKYGPDNPRVLTLEDEIKEMRRAIADKSFDENRERVYEPNPAKRDFEQELLRLEAERTVLEAAVQKAQAEMTELDQKFTHLPQQQIELAGFMQRRAAADERQRALFKSAAAAKLVAELDLCDFELLEPARTAHASRSKLATLFPILLLVTGLIGGTLLCVMLEVLDPKLKTPGQIEIAYRAPCLGAVATTGSLALAEAFLPVCRSVHRLCGPPGNRALLLAVMSAQDGEGKSTLAFHLARYWTELGIRTACLDFDCLPSSVLRVPDTVRGLEDLLADRADWSSVCFQQDGVTCAKLRIDTGDLPERMHGKAMTRLLEMLRADFGCVFLATPAYLGSRNAEVIARVADRSVWMIDSSRTPRTMIRLAFDDLDRIGIRPEGILLNFTEPTVPLRGGPA